MSRVASGKIHSNLIIMKLKGPRIVSLYSEFRCSEMRCFPLMFSPASLQMSIKGNKFFLDAIAYIYGLKVQDMIILIFDIHLSITLHFHAFSGFILQVP